MTVTSTYAMTALMLENEMPWTTSAATSAAAMEARRRAKPRRMRLCQSSISPFACSIVGVVVGKSGRGERPEERRAACHPATRIELVAGEGDAGKAGRRCRTHHLANGELSANCTAARPRPRTSSIPVLVVSGSTDLTLPATVRAEGAKGFFKKPVDLDALCAPRRASPKGQSRAVGRRRSSAKQLSLWPIPFVSVSVRFCRLIQTVLPDSHLANYLRQQQL